MLALFHLSLIHIYPRHTAADHCYLFLPLGLGKELFAGPLHGEGIDHAAAVKACLLYTSSMLAPYVTFSLANMLAFDKLNFPILTDMLPGLLCALIGLWIGLGSRHFRSKRI